MTKKIRCNMYLDRENVEKVKGFIEGTGLNLSAYIDLFIGKAASNIDIFYNELEGAIIKEKDGERIVDLYTAYDVLGIFGLGGGATLTTKQANSIRSGKMKIDIQSKKNIELLKELKKK